MTKTEFYTWQNYRCSYEVIAGDNQKTPLLFIHPIGVGLWRKFWTRLIHQWQLTGQQNPIYNPDLLGCGESDHPRVAYTPEDWGKQLHFLLKEVIQQPVIVVVQGASFPIAIKLYQQQPELVKGLILSGPPAWPVMQIEWKNWQKKVFWNLLDSPFGDGFFRYARREKFLRDFSIRQLFDGEKAVDQEWLTMLQQEAKDPETRHAVFAFLAGFWREDYRNAIASISAPTLVIVGETASSISKSGQQETPDARLQDYLACLPQGEGIKLAGRNVLPYESTTEFFQAITPFVHRWS